MKYLQEGSASPSSTQTNLLTFFLPWAMGYQHELGYFWAVGGLLSGVLSCRGFSFSEFRRTLGVVGSCVVVLLALGMGLGLATTYILYPFVGMSFLFLPVTFVSSLMRGVVLGWAGLD